MKLHAVSVYDLATQTYARPFYVAHPAQAVRSFQDEINNPESELGKHPHDYELHAVGVFDDATGRTDGEPRQIVRGSDCIRNT